MSDLELQRRRQEIRHAVAQRRWADAAALLADWTRRFPDQVRPWWVRATCLERSGDLAGALKCARRAHSLAPGDHRYADLVDRLQTLTSAAPGPAQTTGEAASPPVPATLSDGEVRVTPDTRRGVEATLVDGQAEPAVQAGGSSHGPPTDADGGSSRQAERPGPGPTAVAGSGDPGSRAAGPVWTTLREGAADVAAPPPSDARRREVGRWADGAIIEGRYEVRGAKRGGMGEVYFVHDRELGLDIAVKTPLPGALATEAGRQRFLREAEAWVALGLHPNICSAYYVREIGGVPRLFIEYVDGGSLEEWLSRRRDASLEERLDVAIQIAAGMEHAHTFRWSDEEGREQRGLVHRDLKPANVLVGADGLAKVTDFGLVGRDLQAEVPGAEPPRPATATREPEAPPLETGASQITSIWRTMTLAGRVMGSPAYMPPEQWDGAHLAGRPADIYAFGCLLYELAAGSRPFELDPRYREADPRAQVAAWRQAHVSQPPRDPRALAPELDLDLAELMLACLVKEPGGRPASFAEVGTRLRAAYPRLTGRPYPREPVAEVALPADSLNNRGVSFACLGQRQRAEDAWRQALAVDPQHPEAGCNLALAEWQHRGATDHEVLGRLAELRRGGDGDWRPDLLAGRLLLALGSYDEALRCLRAAASSGRAAEATRDLVFAVCATAWENGDDASWREIATILQGAGTALRGDPDLLVCDALAARHEGDRDSSRRLWAEAERHLDQSLPSLDAAASTFLPGTQLTRRTDLPLGRITAVAVDPRGTTAAFGTEAGALAVVDPATGDVRTLRGRGRRIRAVALAAGRGVAIVAEDGEPVTSWGLATGERRGLQAHPGYLNALSIDGAERLAAGAGSTGAIVLWDLETLRRTAVIPSHAGFATCVSLSGDGALAVSGGVDGNLTVLDTATERITATVTAHPEGVRAVAVSPDGGLALSGGADGCCHLWDLRRAARVTTLAGHGDAVTFVAVAMDGSRALSGAADGTLRHWDLTTGRTAKSERVNSPVTTGAASADWSVVAASHGTTLSQYRMHELPRYQPAWAVAHLVTSSDAAQRERRFRDLLADARAHVARGESASALEIVGRARGIPGYERAPAGLEAMAEASAPFPRADLVDGWEERVLEGHDGAVTALTVASSGDHAVSCGRDRRLVLWDWRRGEVASQVEVPWLPVAACMVGSGTQVAVADVEGVVRLFEGAGWVAAGTLEGHRGRVHSLASDPLGRWLVSASSDGTARLWAPTEGTCRWVLEGHVGRVLACAVGPDGRSAATGGDDGTLLLWDTWSGRSAGQLDGHGSSIGHLEWSADGRTLLSAGGDGVRLWDVVNGRCLRTVEGEHDSPTCAALTPDGSFAAVGRTDGRVALWHLRTRRLLRLFEGHAGALAAVAFTPEGRRLLSAGADGTIRVRYLDWQPEVRPTADWDASARPYLEVFLAQHTPAEGGPPRWGAEDLQGLLGDLQRRGLGWIRPREVRARLAELAREPASTRLPQPPGPRITPRLREGLRRGRLGVLGVVLVMIPLLVFGALQWSHRQLHLDRREVRARRAHNLTILTAPTLTTRSAPCEPAKLATYLDDYTRPTDSLKDWSAASYCLVTLAEPSTVTPLLDLVRPRPVRTDPITGMQIGSDPAQVMAGVRKAMSGGLSTRQAVESMLARMGEPVVHALVVHLGDPDDGVRDTAAGALALSGTKEGVGALVHRAHDPNALVRLAVARQVADLAAGERLDVDEAFALAEILAGDRDARVRLAVASRLGIFAGRRPRALANQLLRDDDPEVSRAALPHAL